MYFIPLSQIESVELVIHALRAAGGEADCSSCPVRQVCMKQCLTIADAVSKMVEAGTLPVIGDEEEPRTHRRDTAGEGKTGKGHLEVVK
jgi:hypothetical protein